MSNTVTLVVGDWSFDGHEKTDHYMININLSPDELEVAFQEGVKMCGVKWSDEVCADYEDNIVPAETIQKLHTAGIKIDELIDDDRSIESGAFVEIWLQIAQLARPDLVYEYVDDGQTINVGGYGLFY